MGLALASVGIDRTDFVFDQLGMPSKHRSSLYSSREGRYLEVPADCRDCGSQERSGSSARTQLRGKCEKHVTVSPTHESGRAIALPPNAKE